MYSASVFYKKTFHFSFYLMPAIFVMAICDCLTTYSCWLKTAFTNPRVTGRVFHTYQLVDVINCIYLFPSFYSIFFATYLNFIYVLFASLN